MMGVMMGAKYSAEWWEKIAGLNREISAREDPSSVTDDLIQATAGARRSPARTSETPPLEAAPGGDLRKIKTDRFFIARARSCEMESARAANWVCSLSHRERGGVRG
jgi:hypothetical protein